MKLITHNILMCNRKGCTTNNFPLKLVVEKIEEFEDTVAMEYNKALMQKLVEKLHWPALRETALSVSVHHHAHPSQIGWHDALPEELTPEVFENEEFLTVMHSILIKKQVVEGAMICPNCERSYEIKNGIPNMLLREDEVWHYTDLID